MKILKSVKVGGLVYEVVESADIANEGNVWGSTHMKKQKIFLDPDEKDQKKEQTFLHEIMHAVWEGAGLNARYSKDQPKLEEEIICALSHGLFQVLKDNDLLK